jgi:hypothetical protein
MSVAWYFDDEFKDRAVENPGIFSLAFIIIALPSCKYYRLFPL